LRILLCNQWYGGQGGVARYVWNLARGLRELGHQVIIVVCGKCEPSTENGIEIYHVPMRSFRGLRRIPIIGRHSRLLRNLVYSRAVCKKIAGIHREQPIDVVEYADINGEGFFHRRFLRGLPMVVRCHTPYYLLHETYRPGEIDFSCAGLIWRERRMIRAADRITAPSDDLARRIEDYCLLSSGRVETIPNLLETEAYYQHRNPISTTVEVLFLGRIYWAKGIYTFCRAAKLMLAHDARVRITIAGPPKKKGIIGEIESMLAGSMDRVDITGELTREQIYDHLSRADIYVNPALIYESFSYTNAEAMACGTPVVTSNIGGMPQTVGDGGVTFQADNHQGLFEAIKPLIDDASVRQSMGHRAQIRAQTFAYPKVTKRMIEVFQSCLGPK